MTDNPYSPPDVAQLDAESRRAPVCTLMFWLSCVLGLVALGIAANGGYQFWFYTSQKGMTLPSSILAETICVACSGLGMFFSAVKWRRQAASAGAFLFGCSLLAFFGGPLLI